MTDNVRYVLIMLILVGGLVAMSWISSCEEIERLRATTRPAVEAPVELPGGG
jgi:hypothetical protein